MENQNDKEAMIAELIHQLPNPSPESRIWFVDAFRNHQYLEQVIEALIQLGEANSPKEAVEYLEHKIRGLSLRGSKSLLTVTSGDLWHTNKQRKYTSWRLRRALRESKAEENGEEELADIVQSRGTISHIVIGELLSGRILEELKHGSGEQVCFLDKEREISWTDIFSQELPQTQSEFFKILRQSWRSLLPLIDKGLDARLSSKEEKVSQFYGLVENVFQEHIERLRKAKGRGGESAYFYFLTLMSWATALMYYRKVGKQPLFCELQAVARRFGLSGGRIDALRIDQRYLSSKQKALLETVIQERYEMRRKLKRSHSRHGLENNNVGEFFRSLKHRLGKGRLEAIIDEWKFAVGDGSSKVIDGPDGRKLRQYKLITHDEVKDKPLSHHLEQLKRYLATSNIGLHWLLQEEGINTRWPEDVYLSRGRLIYFLPSSLPVVHEVTITAEDQNSFYTETLVGQWTAAERRMVVRSVNNIVVGDIIQGLKGKPNGNRKTIAVDPKSYQASFLPPAEEGSRLKQMIDKTRSFLDEYRIVEFMDVKERGKDRTRYEMHLDRLIEAIRQRKVINGSFQFNRPGFVRCFLPGHNDSNPSFYIDPENGFFKCYGCGIGGIILPTSMPDDLSFSLHLTNWRWSEKTYSQTIEYKIPDERYLAIMLQAQEILAKCFRSSPGEEYLVKQRCLDADLAQEKGVGFGTDLLINGLLDAGFSLEELVHYGFVAFSNTFNRFSDISHILNKRGLLIPENPGKEGYCVSVLYDRITFPLALFGKINNFYGRIIRDNNRQFFHRKLKTKYTGVAHGGFNMQVLEDSNVEEVFPVEGCCDALALMQLCQLPSIGIIGTENMIILEALANSGKKVGSALDYDESGRKKTHGYYIERKGGTRQWEPGLLERLEQKGVSREALRDFTGEYVDSHPEIQEIIRRSEEIPGKPKLADWNDWLRQLARKEV